MIFCRKLKEIAVFFDRVSQYKKVWFNQLSLVQSIKSIFFFAIFQKSWESCKSMVTWTLTYHFAYLQIKKKGTIRGRWANCYTLTCDKYEDYANYGALSQMKFSSLKTLTVICIAFSHLSFVFIAVIVPVIVPSLPFVIICYGLWQFCKIKTIFRRKRKWYNKETLERSV